MLTTLRDSDLEILRYCHELRFCTMDHLTGLTGRHRQALNLRLNQLIAQKYIYRFKFPNPNQKHIYSLGTHGFRHLAYTGLIAFDDVPSRLRTSELKPFFLEHTLLVTDIHAALMLASRNTQNRLVEWQEGKILYDSVTFYEDNRKIRLPVCPDGFFSIERGPGTRVSFALEADRNTTTHRTFNDKLRAYCHYLEQGHQQQMYGVKWFRLLTVTLTEARAENLANLSTVTVPERLRKYFLFTTRDRFLSDGSNRVYTDIYRTAKNPKLVSLLPWA